MQNLDPRPPSPQIKDWKMARFCPSRGFILDLGVGGGGGGLLFHFILSKIAALCDNCSTLISEKLSNYNSFFLKKKTHKNQ